MNIAIIGTRGVPNNYGGFEQFAEFLSEGLVRRGHTVSVYNPHTHPFQQKKWKGVNIIHKFDPEYKLGTAGQFIYDLNCIIDSCKRDFEVILQLGYTSSSIWGRLLPKKPVIITNMDGMEWKRSKYSRQVQRFIKFAEKLAVNTSDYLIADSIGIQRYLSEKYQVSAHYIPYGATVFNNPDPLILSKYKVLPYQYNMLIARLEPENSIEMILEGIVKSDSTLPMLIIGNHTSVYGKYLKDKFSLYSNLWFIGTIYDLVTLNNLRLYTNLYFHGHTVGGTNPSLLEAMASCALICANDNEFNRAILGTDAYYFSNSSQITSILQAINRNKQTQGFIDNNYNKILSIYSWENIIIAYEKYMLAKMK